MSTSIVTAQTYMVTDVQSDDTLNVRVESHYKSYKLGELSYDATGIILKECENGWCTVEYRDIDGDIHHGWVNSKYLKRESIVDKGVPKESDIGKPFLNIGHSSEVSTIAEDENIVVTGGSLNGTIKIWQKKSNKLLRTIEAHTNSVNALVIDGDTIISGGGDNLVKIWDIKSGRLIRTLRGHKCYISALDVYKDIIVSGSASQQMGCSEGNIKVWNKTNGGLIKTLDGSMEEYEDISILDILIDDNYIVSVAENMDEDEKWYKIWLRNSGELRYQKGFTDDFRLDFPSNFSTDIKNKYYKKQEFIKNHMEDKSYISSLDSVYKDLSVARHKDIVVSTNMNNNIEVWSIDKASLIREIDTNIHSGVHEDGIGPIGLNDQFIIAVYDKDIKIWSLKTGSYVGAIPTNISSADAIQIVGDTISISSQGDNIELYSLSKKQLIKTINTEDVGYIRSNHIQSESKIIAIADEDIIIYSKRTGEIEKKIKFPFGYSDDPASLNTINLQMDNDRLVATELTRTSLNTKNIKKIVKVRLIDIDTSKVVEEYDNYNIIDRPILENGTIKIFKSDNKGDFIRFLFVNGEWVVITPEGYFNASKHGAKYLNILTAPMSVTSVDAYYETFYRPDIVKSALSGEKVDTGLIISNIMPAPSVRIINTPLRVSTDEVKITLAITDVGGGIGNIRLYLNGVAVKTDTRAIVRKQSNKSIQQSYTIKLPRGKSIIKVLVFNKANTMQSDDISQTIVAEYKSTHKPELHALIIGIDTFKNPKLQLKYAASDANLFAETIKTQTKEIFSQIVVHILDTKENTSKKMITQKLKELQGLNPDDFFVFYVASHGTVDDGEYFLITSNVGSTSTRKLKADAIMQVDLKRLIANIPTMKKLIVLDTCNAGAMGNALLTRGMSDDTAMKILSRAVGSTILSAATSQQQALEGYHQHGLFTYVLAEGLKGKADSNNDGYVKTIELANYIDDKVPELAERLFNRAQYPVVSPTGQGFPIGKVK